MSSIDTAQVVTLLSSCRLPPETPVPVRFIPYVSGFRRSVAFDEACMERCYSCVSVSLIDEKTDATGFNILTMDLDFPGLQSESG